MTKRNIVEALDKHKNLIDGNDGISVQLQSKLLKSLTTIYKHVTPIEPKEKRPAGTSQFEKQMPISKEMIQFAGWEDGVSKSRVEVTKAVWDYIKDNDLREEQNKRICKLNDKLKTLLDTTEPTLTYPQIQKYIGKHILKQ